MSRFRFPLPLGAVLVCSLYEKECLIFLPLFAIICWFLYRFYINCSRELNRIEGVLNSPILNLVNETIKDINAESVNNENLIIENIIDNKSNNAYINNETNNDITNEDEVLTSKDDDWL